MLHKKQLQLTADLPLVEEAFWYWLILPAYTIMSYTLADYVVHVNKCRFDMIVILHAFGKRKYCH